MGGAVAALHLLRTSLPFGIWHFGWVQLSQRSSMRSMFSAALAACSFLLSVPSAVAQSQMQRGEYLTTIMDCTGCHTPGTFLGKPDLQRPLAGSEPVRVKVESEQ
jgi:hypothetical protein